jgi:hypothetical protein
MLFSRYKADFFTFPPPCPPPRKSSKLRFDFDVWTSKKRSLRTQEIAFPRFSISEFSEGGPPYKCEEVNQTTGSAPVLLYTTNRLGWHSYCIVVLYYS